jgi:hypothetical protein
MLETLIFLRKVLILTWHVNRNVEIFEKVYTILAASLLYKVVCQIDPPPRKM